MSKVQFNEGEVQKADEYFKRAHLADDQREVITALSKVFAKYIDIPEMALRGFSLRGAVAWQLEQKKDASTIKSMTPEERAITMVQLLQKIKDELMKIVVNKSDESLLDKAFKAVLEYYKNTYAKR